MSKKGIVILFVLLVSLFLIACAKPEMSEDSTERETLILADQFGLAYAPLEIMKSEQFLEKNLSEAGLDHIKIEWKKYGNTTAVREAMLSGDLDIGFVGIPPFLLGVDNGMNWKIISGLSESRVSLISKDSAVDSISDLTDRHRVILPQPGSIQHILLQMVAENTMGDAKLFDDQLIALTHPDGVVAFSSGDETQLHFTTPPFLQADLEVSGSKEIATGETCFGGAFTFIVGICQEDIYNETLVYQAFEKALTQSLEFMENNKEETIQILSSAYEFTPEALKIYLQDDQLTFTTEIKGLDRFVEFMHQNGNLKKTYSTDELVWKSKN